VRRSGRRCGQTLGSCSGASAHTAGTAACCNAEVPLIRLAVAFAQIRACAAPARARSLIGDQAQAPDVDDRLRAARLLTRDDAIASARCASLASRRAWTRVVGCGLLLFPATAPSMGEEMGRRPRPRERFWASAAARFTSVPRSSALPQGSSSDLRGALAGGGRDGSAWPDGWARAGGSQLIFTIARRHRGSVRSTRVGVSRTGCVVGAEGGEFVPRARLPPTSDRRSVQRRQ
jgi:hypothetical protein